MPTSFVPRCCPLAHCPSSTGQQPFSYQCRGSYRRKCDGRLVRRFSCNACSFWFSEQSFRLDYRLRRPELTAPAFFAFASKVTHRQAARTIGCARGTIEHRLALLGSHCESFQRVQLERLKGHLPPDLALDELETYEQDRRLKPLTVPVLIQETTWFVLDVEVAPLASRGGLTPEHAARKERLVEREGKRSSGSREAVRRCLERIGALVDPASPGLFRSDEKTTYVRLKQRYLPEQVQHVRVNSKEPRGLDNPLFRINRTLAMLRDGVSRLVRRTWAASKKAANLARHLWIWIAFRNYVRRMINRTAGTSAASALRLFDGPLPTANLLGLRARFRSDPPLARAAS